MKTHNLTTDQLRKLVDAVGDGKDFPKLTDDSVVNFAIDCLVVGDEETGDFDASIYVAEIVVAKSRGVTFPVA